MEMKRDENRTLWKIGGGAGLKCTFSPTFAPGTEITCVKVNGKKVRFSIDKSSAYVVPVLQLRLSEDDTIVEFSSSSGVGALQAVRVRSIVSAFMFPEATTAFRRRPYLSKMASLS